MRIRPFKRASVEAAVAFPGSARVPRAGERIPRWRPFSGIWHFARSKITKEGKIVSARRRNQVAAATATQK
ncbi:MAG: hypothetical protein DMF39_04275 [Verrucomicrobia bacterium]|nr:MAG: hypothetical protein DMF39_04275 [Verrucomicrobiota bacterium]